MAFVSVTMIRMDSTCSTLQQHLRRLQPILSCTFHTCVYAPLAPIPQLQCHCVVLPMMVRCHCTEQPSGYSACLTRPTVTQEPQRPASFAMSTDASHCSCAALEAGVSSASPGRVPMVAASQSVSAVPAVAVCTVGSRWAPPGAMAHTAAGQADRRPAAHQATAAVAGAPGGPCDSSAVGDPAAAGQVRHKAQCCLAAWPQKGGSLYCMESCLEPAA